MMYEDLPQEVRTDLEAKRVALVRRSSLIGEQDKIDDVILFSKDSSEVTTNLEHWRGHGYEVETPKQWFEYVAKPYEGDDAKQLELAKGALLEA